MRNYNPKISLGTNFVGAYPCMCPIKDGYYLQGGVHLGNISKDIPTVRDVPTVLPTISVANNCKRKLPPQEIYCKIINHGNYLNFGRSVSNSWRVGKGGFLFCSEIINSNFGGVR